MTLRSYLIGFILSAALTIAAFWAAYALGTLAIPLIVGAALIQLVIQLTFFLHIGENASRSHLVSLGLTLVILCIVIGGTLWIMYNLEHLHINPPTLDQLYQGGVPAPQNELN